MKMPETIGLVHFVGIPLVYQASTQGAEWITMLADAIGLGYYQTPEPKKTMEEVYVQAPKMLLAARV